MKSLSLGHDEFMCQAIEMAEKNPQAPFGSVLVDRRMGRAVASGVNASLANPTLHGEIAAINDYAHQRGRNWSQLTIYSTAEPCCMCQGAILWAGIEEVIFGISIADLQQFGWQQIDIPATKVIERSWNPQTRVIGGICRDECLQLFKQAHRD